MEALRLKDSTHFCGLQSREIMHLIAAVRPIVDMCVWVCLSDLSQLNQGLIITSLWDFSVCL